MLWIRDGKIVVDGDGHPIDCDHCPCTKPGTCAKCGTCCLSSNAVAKVTMPTVTTNWSAWHGYVDADSKGISLWMESLGVGTILTLPQISPVPGEFARFRYVDNGYSFSGDVGGAGAHPTVITTLACAANQLELLLVHIGVLYSNGTSVENIASVYYYGPGCNHMAVSDCNHLSSGLVPCSVYPPGGYPNPPVSMSGTIDVKLANNDCCYQSGTDTCTNCAPVYSAPRPSHLPPEATPTHRTTGKPKAPCPTCSRAKKRAKKRTP